MSTILPIRAAGLRLEMSVGRINAMTQGGGTDIDNLDEAVFDAESQRNYFRQLVEEATGMDVPTLMRMLAL